MDLEIDRGKVLTPRTNCKIDKDRVLGTNKRFLEKSRKMGQKDDKKGKNQEIDSQNRIVRQLFDFQKKTVK